MRNIHLFDQQRERIVYVLHGTLRDNNHWQETNKTDTYYQPRHSSMDKAQSNIQDALPETLFTTAWLMHHGRIHF